MMVVVVVAVHADVQPSATRLLTIEQV